MKKTKKITYITSALDLWFLGLAWQFPLAAEYLLELLQKSGLQTFGHAIAQRNKSQEPIITFLTKGLVDVEPEKFLKASVDHVKDYLELAAKICEGRIAKSLQRAQQEKVSATLKAVADAQSSDLKAIADAFTFGQQPANPSFYYLNQELNPRNPKFQRL